MAASEYEVEQLQAESHQLATLILKHASAPPSSFSPAYQGKQLDLLCHAKSCCRIMLVRRLWRIYTVKIWHVPAGHVTSLHVMMLLQNEVSHVLMTAAHLDGCS